MHRILEQVCAIAERERAEWLPEVTPRQLEQDGAVFYMNSQNGTEFDWHVNDRLPSFMVFYNDKANLGAVKLHLNRNGTVSVYLYGEQGARLQKQETLPAEYTEEELLGLAVQLRQAADEMLDYQGSGQSVMEMSHRSKVFDDLINETEEDLRDLMQIPDNYKVLFVQGGGNMQFAMVPMNLFKNKVGDYIITGQWAKKAYQEAKMFGTANAIASSADKTFSYIPDCSDLPVDEDADYVYICLNNTIYGTVYHELPNTKGKTLVADISSCFLSEPLDVSKFGILWGGVQKNVGPAGMAIVIIREDLITEDVLPGTPTMLRYKTYADNDSLYNTPPTYTIYMCGKVFKWLKKMGGLSAMKERNEKKAKILYDFLDESKLFKGTVEKKDRSLMNVPFVTGDADLDALFVKEAKEAGFVNLKGHRTVGGMRASIYNAMPIEGVEKLVAFMREFEKKHTN